MSRFLLFILLLLTTAAFSQKITVSATVNEQRILIGEQFELKLTATMPAAQNLQWFEVKELPHFEILNRSKIDSQINSNKKTVEQSFTLTAWDSGRWSIPSFSLQGSNATKPITIRVSFAPLDPKQPYHDVKDILEVSRPVRVNWYWYLVVLALLAALFLLLFPNKKKKKEERLVEGAYRKALLQLEALKKKNLAERDAKAFYTELIDIFRQYLHLKKNIQSFSKTTEDLGWQLGTLQLPATDYQQLLETLQLSDFVKFARYQPLPSENQLSFDVIKKSIITIEKLIVEEKKETNSL